jgi:septal ring factor EnvC (AmiA/AmiB activator)
MYNCNLGRIAAALEKQNEIYKLYSDKHVRFAEEAAKDRTTHNDLISQIVSLNERLVQMQGLIEDQEREIKRLRGQG